MIQGFRLGASPQWFHRPFRADQWLLHAMVRRPSVTPPPVANEKTVE
jgi:hypothetical protein